MPPTTTETMTLNKPWPARRWSRPYEVTLDNTISNANLQIAGLPFRYIQNVGTAGAVVIAWGDALDEVTIYLAQGQVMEGGHWVHAKLAGTDAGVVLRGFRGVEGVAY